KQLVREQTSHVQRLQKTLEEANIKLDSVISDVMGLSGRAMIEALIAGETNPERLARLAHRRIKATRRALCEALDGRVTDHHRFRLRLHRQQYDRLDHAISAVGTEIATVIALIDQEREAAGQAPFRVLSREICNAPGRAILSRGRVCVPGRTRAAANANPRDCARARRGSRPRWCNARSPPARKRTAISGRSSSASRPGPAPPKPSARWPHRCSPQSTTSSRTAPRIATSGPIPLTNGQPR